MENTEHLICDCSSLEHQMLLWWDEEDKSLYAYVHLTTNRNFFQRLWYGIKYAFGYKSRFGPWDEFIFSENAEQKLIKCIENARNSRSQVN